jgi:hypothetical protein
MKDEERGPHQKALHINLDPCPYGTFAEIGAGQEVARWFFRVGGAAGTIAKTMSAYDMTFSDAIYGPTERYVTRQRLQNMLDHEYDLLLERLRRQRGGSTRFFVFADTVRARSYGGSAADESHGWLGVRFQTEPASAPSQVILHARLLDRENLPQQEALGIMGVNVVYGCLYLHHDPVALMASLLDHLSTDRVEVDLIKFSGPAFQRVDNRLLSLELVRQGLTSAALFTADGEVVQASEILHKKPILVARGRFRPVTRLTLDMLDCAQARLRQDARAPTGPMVVLTEMTLKHLSDSGAIDYKDFLDRVDLLGALGQTVLISDYAELYRLAAYLFRYTREPIAVAMTALTLRDLFDERQYADLDGGILESFGRLFKNALKLHVYPQTDPDTGERVTAENLVVAPHLRHLCAHLRENQHIQGLRGFQPDVVHINAREVAKMIRAGDATWETLVPPRAAQLIKERKLFGCR